MVSFDRNVSEKEGMMRLVAGLAAMIIGLFVFLVNPLGVVVPIIGIAAFASGYFQWCPLRALTSR